LNHLGFIANPMDYKNEYGKDNIDLYKHSNPVGVGKTWRYVWQRSFNPTKPWVLNGLFDKKLPEN